MIQKTLKTACEAFIDHLKANGVAQNSLASYAWNLRLLIGHFGEEKDISKLLAAHVAGFFRSEIVTTKNAKDGTRMPRTSGSTAQIRRVVRWALVYWNEMGWTDKVPLPGDEKRFLVEKSESASDEIATPARRTRKTKVKDDGGIRADNTEETSAVDEPESSHTVSEPVNQICSQTITEPEECLGSNDARDADGGPEWQLL